jgi:hypothetical protein
MPTSYYPAVSDRSNINQLRFQQSYPATRMDTFSVVVVGSIELMKSCFDITSALLSESRHQHIREQFGELHDLLSTVEGACPDGQRRDVDSQVHSLARDIQKQTGVLHDLLRNFAGACPGGQRHLEDSKIHTLAQDLEQAEKCQTASFEFAISQEIRPQKQWRRRGMTRLRLVRSLAGASLMYPVCMLIMSNYAVTRGLLQGCSRLELHPLGVSTGCHEISNETLTKISISYHSCRNACSGRHRSHSSPQASSGHRSSTYTITATSGTNSRKRSWLERLLSDCFYALGVHGMHWVS